MFAIKKIFNIRNFALLLYLNGLLWFVFSIWLFLSDRSKIFHGLNLYDVLSLLMLFNFLIFLLLAYLVFKKYKYSFHLSFIWLLLNFLLTFTDQFGLLDVLVLLLNIFSLVYCLFLRKELIPKIDLRKEILEKNQKIFNK